MFEDDEIGGVLVGGIRDGLMVRIGVPDAAGVDDGVAGFGAGGTSLDRGSRRRSPQARACRRGSAGVVLGHCTAAGAADNVSMFGAPKAIRPATIEPVCATLSAWS